MKETLEEKARRLGISVATLKRQIKEAREEKAARKAAWELAEKSAGWNNHGGPKKKHKGY